MPSEKGRWIGDEEIENELRWEIRQLTWRIHTMNHLTPDSESNIRELFWEAETGKLTSQSAFRHVDIISTSWRMRTSQEMLMETNLVCFLRHLDFCVRRKDQVTVANGSKNNALSTSDEERRMNHWGTLVSPGVRMTLISSSPYGVCVSLEKIQKINEGIAYHQDSAWLEERE